MLTRFQRGIRRSCASVGIVLLVTTAGRRDMVAVAQQHPRQQPPVQSLGDVLHLVIDQNKDGTVTMTEVETHLAMLQGMFADTGGGGDGAPTETLDYEAAFHAVTRAAPIVFDLMDTNQDQGVSKTELKFATEFEKAIKPATNTKTSKLKEFVRYCFETIDTDQDAQLSPAELLAVLRSNEDDETTAVSQIARKLYELFPNLRATATALEEFIASVLTSTMRTTRGETTGGEGGITLEEVTTGMHWIDTNQDGRIQRTEVGQAYNKFGKQFLELSKQIKTMGPLLAMMGGGGGMGGMNTEF